MTMNNVNMTNQTHDASDDSKSETTRIEDNENINADKLDELNNQALNAHIMPSFDSDNENKTVSNTPESSINGNKKQTNSLTDKVKTRWAYQNDNVIGTLALIMIVSAFLASMLKLCQPFTAFATILCSIFYIPYYPRRKTFAIANINDYKTGFDKFIFYLNIIIVMTSLFRIISANNKIDWILMLIVFLMLLFIPDIRTLSPKYHYKDAYVNIMVHSIQLTDEHN